MSKSQDYGFLQLFSEPGAAGTQTQSTGTGTGGAEGAATGATTGTGQQTQGSAAAAGGQSAEPTLTPEQQAAFDKRFGAEKARLERELRAQYESRYGTTAKLEKLLRAQGYDPAQVMTEFESQARAHQAQQYGVSPELLSQFQEMRQEVASLREERLLNSLEAETKALAAEPGLNPVIEQHGSTALEFAKKYGVSMEQALYAVAGKAITDARVAAKEQEVLANVTGRSTRTPVAASTGTSGKADFDPSKLPKEEFEKFLSDVKAGRAKIPISP